MDAAFLIPAYNAARSLPAVVEGLMAACQAQRLAPPLVLVVDDGSSDDTGLRARQAGAQVVRHPANRGKGAALQTGLRALYALRLRAAVSLDADGQHLPEEALRLALHPAPLATLVLAVRDLRGAGAPRLNRFSNGFSNLFLSLFAGVRLRDTQCGLRRYPIFETLNLGASSPGFAFEAEVLLRARARGLEITQEPAIVYYPPESERTSHFHGLKDPARIVARVLYTVAAARLK